MGIFASADFVGTNGALLNVADPAWTKHPNYATTAVIESNQVACGGTGASAIAHYTHANAPSGADYSVFADIVFTASNVVFPVGVTGRGSTSASTFYAATYAGAGAGATNGNWRLFKVVAGTLTILGQFQENEPANGTVWQVELRMAGSTIQLCRKGESAALISVTDTSITEAGVAGLYIQRNQAGDDCILDNWRAEEDTAALRRRSPLLLTPW